MIISPRCDVQEKNSKKSHSAENESFSALLIFIHGPELYPDLKHSAELHPIVIHWRTILYIITLSRTIPYLNTLSRTIPYVKTLSRTITYLNTSSRTQCPKPENCRLQIRLEHERPSYSVNQSESGKEIPSISSANQNRVLRHPGRQPIRREYYVTRELSAWLEVLFRLSARVGSL